MAFRRASRAPCVLEVERKFRSLAVAELTQYGGIPHFQSLRRLPSQSLRDAYYDRSSLLSSAGAWVRKRNGEWQAKIKQGGNFTNSRFEEICGARNISEHVRRITNLDGGESDNFGLHPIATFSTRRETWIADDEFHIVLDTMDFGHEVGEVELQQEVLPDAEEGFLSQRRKQRVMQDMDERVSKFMKQYSWAFSQGRPKGKLTAYFERMSV